MKLYKYFSKFYVLVRLSFRFGFFNTFFYTDLTIPKQILRVLSVFLRGVIVSFILCIIYITIGNLIGDPSESNITESRNVVASLFLMFMLIFYSIIWTNIRALNWTGIIYSLIFCRVYFQNHTVADLIELPLLMLFAGGSVVTSIWVWYTYKYLEILELRKQDLFKMIYNDLVSHDKLFKLFNRGHNLEEHFRIHSQIYLNEEVNQINYKLREIKFEFVRAYAMSFYYDMLVRYISMNT
jgi:hypothetical protein